MTDKIQVQGLKPLAQYARTQAQMEEMRRSNSDKYAASGFIHYGKHRDDGGNFNAINEGLFTYLLDPNQLKLGRVSGNNESGTSKTDFPVSQIAGFVSKLYSMNSVVAGSINAIKFPEAPDGTVTYDSSTGAVVKHPNVATAFQSETATNKVVTDRVDLVGLEFFLEEVTAANPFVYPYGCIQSQATTMNGVATSASNRPVTYYAVYDGDTTSKGKGVDFFAASYQQRCDMLADESNNLFLMDNGDLVQWRVRQRTIAGAGNGDFEYTDPSVTSHLRYSGNANIMRQGVSNTPHSGSSLNSSFGGSFVSTTNTTIDNSLIDNKRPQGAWSMRYSGASYAYNGECYFYVVGRYPRLNQGAFHPAFNPSGSASATDGKWYQSSLLTTKESCFTNASSGQIGGTSGRDDGKFYDAIYADTFCDDRLPAQDAKGYAWGAWEKVKSGKYRGEQRTVFTKVGTVTTTGSVFSDGYTKLIGAGQRYSQDFAEWEGYLHPSVDYDIPNCFIVGDSGAVYPLGSMRVRINDGSTCYVSKSAGNVASDFKGGTYHVVIGRDDFTNVSVGGDYTHVDVIGDPSEILATPDLAQGWLGSWIPVIPDGTSKFFPLTRKNIGSTSVDRQYTDNNGSTWTDAVLVVDNVTNGHTAVQPANRLHILSYTVAAKVTKESSNKPVLDGSAGLGDVTQLARYDYSLMMESLIGKVGISDSSKDLGSLNVLSYTIEHGNTATAQLGELSEVAAYAPMHAPVDMVAPTNNSPAVKALPYLFEENGTINFGVQANELTYDTDWGDDSKVKSTASGTGTFTDLNGNTNIQTVHELAKRIGYAVNQAKGGS